MGDVLVLRREVLTHSSSATGYSRILTTDDFEVLILALLYKGDSSGFYTNNASIELEVLSRGEQFSLLCQKPSFLQLSLLLFGEALVSHKESIVGLEANDTEGLIAIE